MWRREEKASACFVRNDGGGYVTRGGKRRRLAPFEMTVGWGEELREAGDGEVAGAIGRERGAEKAQRDRDKLKMANEKEEERFHREKTRDGGAVLSPRTDKE